MERLRVGRPLYLLVALVFLVFWVSPVLAVLLIPTGLVGIRIYRRGADGWIPTEAVLGYSGSDACRLGGVAAGAEPAAGRV
jgi:hypothetical protein